MSHVVSVVAKVTKNLANDISKEVRRATQHLRADPLKSNGPQKDVDDLLEEAHTESLAA